MKLSEAILKGCEMYSQQCIGEYYEGETAACALGAIYAGVMGKDTALLGYNVTALSEVFPILWEDAAKFGLPRMGHSGDVGDWVFLQNDSGVSREEIARILAERGL